MFLKQGKSEMDDCKEKKNFGSKGKDSLSFYSFTGGGARCQKLRPAAKLSHWIIIKTGGILKTLIMLNFAQFVSINCKFIYSL